MEERKKCLSYSKKKGTKNEIDLSTAFIMTESLNQAFKPENITTLQKEKNFETEFNKYEGEVNDMIGLNPYFNQGMRIKRENEQKKIDR